MQEDTVIRNMENRKYKLSNNGLLFIKKYALSALGLKLPLSEENLDTILEYAMECELKTIDDNGYDLPDNKITEEDKLSEMFGTELSLHCDEEIDLEDLNQRLK